MLKSTVKNISVHYDPINETNTFTNGDYVSGRVTVEVARECSVASLSVKFKGKAEVRWTEQHGQSTVVYHSKDKYFSIKRFFIRGGEDTADSNVLTPGSHVYPFTFQIPGHCGKVVYRLDTALSRSMRVDSKDSAKINFVSAVDPGLGASLMTPLHDSKHTKLKAFNHGSVAMDVNLEKTGYSPGEGMKVVAFVQNNSSRDIKLKYCVYRKHSFFAMGRRRVDTKDLLKESGDPIKPSANQTVTKVISIPHDAEPTVRCCSIIQAEYRLRVYLDVKRAFLAEGLRSEIAYGIWKRKGEQVGSSCEQTVTKTITISSLQRPSILNCSIIKLEYRLKYDRANNSNNAFTSGDTITGRIIVQVSKKTSIQSLTFRANGNANVRWASGRLFDWSWGLSRALMSGVSACPVLS
ncbi:hypothetical protein CRUP_029520 [Coryphaenoides rupestris]|nr:hypothetical protein CRUP_029520 [Coryphaenoides rupestris]